MVKVLEELINSQMDVNFKRLDPHPYLAVCDRVNGNLFLLKGLSKKDFYDWYFRQRWHVDEWKGRHFIIIRMDIVEVKCMHIDDGKHQDFSILSTGKLYETYTKLVNAIIPLATLTGIVDVEDITDWFRK